MNPISKNSTPVPTLNSQGLIVNNTSANHSTLKKGFQPMDTLSLNNNTFESKNTTTVTKAESKKILELTAQDIKLHSYAGSKLKYSDIFNKVNEKMQVKKVKLYIEGFAGTLASVFHNLQHIEADRIVLNDINKRLINLYIQIQNNPDEVIEKYKLLENEYNRIIPKNLQGLRLVPKENREEFKNNQAFYFEARKLLNAVDSGSNQAALWLFVMNHNFNGLYSENKKGEMNTSFNWSSKPVNVEKIETSIKNLNKFFTTHNVVFENLDIDTLIEKYNEEDTMIYLDPAYLDSSIQYSTKNKNKNNIEESFANIARHKRMIEQCSKYKYVLYSNKHHEDFIEIFDSYINFTRTNSISAGDTKKSKLEILAFKINVEKVVCATPITELLGITLDTGEVANNTQYKAKADKAITSNIPIPKGITSILSIDKSSIQTKHSKTVS